MKKEKILNYLIRILEEKKITKSELDHDGIIGHKLEKLMNIKHNANNVPDIYGYEMKKYSNKITFGDWSASEYIFSKQKDIIDKLNKQNICISRDKFLEIFGTPNERKMIDILGLVNVSQNMINGTIVVKN